MAGVIHQFIAEEGGATAIEYGLIAALVSGAAIAALQSMGQSVEALFGYVGILASAAAQRP